MDDRGFQSPSDEPLGVDLRSDNGLANGAGAFGRIGLCHRQAGGRVVDGGRRRSWPHVAFPVLVFCWTV